jgi:DNA repair protein RadC
MDESGLADGNYLGYRVRVRLVREGDEQYEPRALTSSRDVYEFFKPLEDADREYFYSLHLDTKQQVISCDEVSSGTLDCSLVHPREVYKAAILSSAASIITAHNHPSGDPTPSREDREITHRLAEAGRLLGIPLLDSVIIGHGRYHSMKDEGEI